MTMLHRRCFLIYPLSPVTYTHQQIKNKMNNNNNNKTLLLDNSNELMDTEIKYTTPLYDFPKKDMLRYKPNKINIGLTC